MRVLDRRRKHIDRKQGLMVGAVVFQEDGRKTKGVKEEEEA